MTFYVGAHDHRHGTSSYLFESEEEMTTEDFITYLGDAFESDREEWVEFSVAEVIPFTKKGD